MSLTVNNSLLVNPLHSGNFFLVNVVLSEIDVRSL